MREDVEYFYAYFKTKSIFIRFNSGLANTHYSTTTLLRNYNFDTPSRYKQSIKLFTVYKDKTLQFTNKTVTVYKHKTVYGLHAIFKRAEINNSETVYLSLI